MGIISKLCCCFFTPSASKEEQAALIGDSRKQILCSAPIAASGSGQGSGEITNNLNSSHSFITNDFSSPPLTSSTPRNSPVHFSMANTPERSGTISLANTPERSGTISLANTPQRSGTISLANTPDKSGSFSLANTPLSKSSEDFLANRLSLV